MRGSDKMPCPFCVDKVEAFLHNELAYARCDLNPVTPGHLLLIPFRHTASFFDLSAEEQRALLALLGQAKSVLDESHAPAGYNIGVNVGAAAGQTILHAHLHLIPRYLGDAEHPRGGVRAVIPGRQSY